MQVPSKHLNSLFAVEENPAHVMASEPEPALHVFPSFGSISNVGTATPVASETGEEEAPQKHTKEMSAKLMVRNYLSRLMCMNAVRGLEGHIQTVRKNLLDWGFNYAVWHATVCPMAPLWAYIECSKTRTYSCTTKRQ